MINDRLKFRAWSKCDNRYYDVAALGQDRSALEGTGWVKNSDDFVFEQCTGLKDKNGKLIYEGDIVQHDDGSKFEIQYNTGWACWTMENFIFPMCKGATEGHYEVIGNIHEGEKK